MLSSDALNVHQFTTETGHLCPDTPQVMSKESAKFIIRMVMSELDELACTVCETADERDQLMQDALDSRDPCEHLRSSYQSKEELIGAQFDALVDAWYYSLNTAAKHGVNMSKIFNVVHTANMNKRDPKTGKFLRRESDGKIIKPEGWQAPDITAEITKQTVNGAWSLEHGA